MQKPAPCGAIRRAHPRIFALGATGIEVQGPLEDTQKERLDDTFGLGTSLTLGAPAADNRDLTPSSALGKRVIGSVVQKTVNCDLISNSSGQVSKNPWWCAF